MAKEINIMQIMADVLCNKQNEVIIIKLYFYYLCKIMHKHFKILFAFQNYFYSNMLKII